MEADTKLTTLEKSSRRDDARVARRDVPLIGVSGHTLSVIPTGREVEAFGEAGSYTQVTWQGRNGYVLTESLVSALEFETAPEEEPEQVDSEPEGGQSRLGRLGLAAIACAIAGVIFLALGKF